MALFEYRCPSCNQSTTLDPSGACTNLLKGGDHCGYTFPLRFGVANSKVRGKKDKHTQERPAGKDDKDWSWVNDDQEYALYQECCALSGDVVFDSEGGYLCLCDSPHDGQDFAKVLYANECSVSGVGVTVLPLNSKLQNMHVHFDDWKEHFHKIADHSDEIVVREPQDGSTDYTVLSAGDVIFSWDPVSAVSAVNVPDEPES